MSRKKILILGAGVYQVPLIKTAKKLGHEAIVVSWEGNYPGFKFSDKNIYLDTTDYENVLKFAKEEKIDGVCTTGTDVALITLGKICDSLNLNGPSFEAVQLSTDKKKMKKAFMENNVRTAKYIEVKTLDECYKAFDDLTKPVIFKAVDSSGSRGIIKVEKKEEIDKAFNYVFESTKKDYFIIEEFIIGEEFGAQAFVRDGKLIFIMPHGDMVFQGDTGVPIGHYVPYNLDKEILDDLELQLKNAVKALKLNNCALNADFILRDKDIYVLEIGARAGATCLAEMVGIHYKTDYFEFLIKSCLGEPMDIKMEHFVPCAAELMMSNKTGIIKEIINKNQPADYIIDISFDHEVGEKVDKFRVGPDRIGQIIVIGNTLQEALDNLEKVKKNIEIIVE